MTINVQLQPQTPVIPGQARLTIKKWQGGLEGLEFSIQRNQDRYYLQQQQDWGTNAVWFPITLTEDEAGHLEGLIGADILDPILEGSGIANYQLHLQQGPGGENDRGMVKLVDGLFGSAAGGTTASTRVTADLVQPMAEPDPAIIPEPVIAPLVAEPAPEPTPEPIVVPKVVAEPAAPVVKKKGINPLFIILPIVLVLAIAAGVAWILLNPMGNQELATETTAAAENTPAEEVIDEPNADADEPIADVTPAAAEPIADVTPAVADTSCSIAGLSNQNELSFVQNCIQQNLTSEQLLTVIVGAKDAEQCGVAQRLYANRAQSGDVVIALAYAKEYDPEFHQPNACFAEPDNDTASYWYETVLAADPDNQQAQKRLGALN